MLNAIASSYTGMKAHQLKLDNAAHNIANIGTPGFKERQLSFQDLPYKPLAERRLPNLQQQPRPNQVGTGVRSRPAAVGHYRQGDLMIGSRPTEIAIEGPGFFRITRPDGSHVYTRSGFFSPNAEGNLQAPGGELLLPLLNLAEREDVLPGTLAINQDGVITALNADNEQVELGRIAIYTFANVEGLLSEGATFFSPTPASGEPQEGFPGEEGFGTLQPGYLEQSTVDLSRQMVELIKGQRGLQFSARSLVTAEELWAMSLNIRS